LAFEITLPAVYFQVLQFEFLYLMALQETWLKKMYLHWIPLQCLIFTISTNSNNKYWTPDRVEPYRITALYTGSSKRLCAPDDYNTIVRCTETFWSPCI